MKIKENIALEFNDFSQNYTNDMIGCVPHYLDLITSFVTHLPEQFKPQSILDLGSGNGNVTAQLLPLFPKATYTLVDASKEMIDLCRNQFQDYNMMYVNKYFNEFIFPEENYDLVVAGLSLHHCDDDEKQTIFNNFYTSLKTEGLFAYSDLMINKSNPDHPRLLQQWEAFVHGNFPNGEKWTWLMEHYDAYDKPTDYNSQIDWLEYIGFSKVEIPFSDDYWIHLQAIK